MFGPRAIIACGFKPAEQVRLLEMLDRLLLTNLPVCFPTEEEAELTLHELVELPRRCAQSSSFKLPRAVVLSGVTQQELNQIMDSYRADHLPPKPLWAVMTEASIDWPLTSLLGELAREREALVTTRRATPAAFRGA